MSYRKSTIHKIDENDYSKLEKESQYSSICNLDIIGEMILWLLGMVFFIVYPYLMAKDIINLEKLSFLNVHTSIILVLLILYFIIKIFLRRHKKIEYILIIFTLVSNITLTILFYFDIKLGMIKLSMGLASVGFERTINDLISIHLILNIYLLLQSLKAIKRKKQRNKVQTIDDVLFDEEENIKF